MEVESSKTKQALSEAQSRNQYLQDQVGMQRQVLKEMEQQLQSSQKAVTQLRAQVSPPEHWEEKEGRRQRGRRRKGLPGGLLLGGLRSPLVLLSLWLLVPRGRTRVQVLNGAAPLPLCCCNFNQQGTPSLWFFPFSSLNLVCPKVQSVLDLQVFLQRPFKVVLNEWWL